jgi:DNA polymerase
MLECIKTCGKCGLRMNQPPLLDDEKECDVFFVGLSAKKVASADEKPLSPGAISGKILLALESECGGITAYKTNLVKCLPLDDSGKLRYPSKIEMDVCAPNLAKEIEALRPKIVFLLGSKVAEAVAQFFSLKFEKFDGFEYKVYERQNVSFAPVHHPSYVHVYKRKEVSKYIEKLGAIVQNHC